VVFADAFEEVAVLEVQENSGLFDAASAEDFADDVVSIHWFGRLFEDVGDSFGYGAFFVAPGAEGVNTSTDKHEAGVFNELVVNGLDGDFAAFEGAFGDFFGDVGEMHGLFFLL
jgi:hypothetical protein